MSVTDFDHNCPHCGRVNQAASGAPGTQPSDGDVTLCWKCRRPAIFVVVGGRLAVRLPTAEEEAEIEANPDIRALRAAMAESYTPSEASTLRWGSDNP